MQKLKLQNFGHLMQRSVLLGKQKQKQKQKNPHTPCRFHEPLPMQRGHDHLPLTPVALAVNATLQARADKL